ncbi:type I toxin-antitoxin system toxin Ldr family protein [Escherichia sp. 93.0724]
MAGILASLIVSWLNKRK